VNARSPTNALVVGAISRDLIVGRDGAMASRSGGGVHHGGLALARLGASVHIVTRVHPEDEAELLAPLRAEAVDLLALPSRATTTYRNDYGAREDRHELKAASDPIEPEDVPANWRKPDLVQLTPLHPHDVVPETAVALRGLKGLDVQGLLREPGSDGPDILRRFLARVDVVQVSESDLSALVREESPQRFVQRLGVKEMIITRGDRGATIVSARESREVPTQRVEDGDPIGAGDVFLASYLLLRVSGRDPVGAARGATRACSAKLEHGTIPVGFQLGEDT